MTHTDTWKRLRSEEGPDLKLFRARFDYMLNPRNGQTEKMIVLESTDSVNVVAVTPAQEILFVQQFRFGIGQDTLELPGGMVDPGEDHPSGAARELREETGYTGLKWNYLGKVGSNPVFMDSYIHHWVVEDIRCTHETLLDAGETIALKLIPIPTVYAMLWNGDFMHPHTISGLLRYFAHQKP